VGQIIRQSKRNDPVYPDRLQIAFRDLVIFDRSIFAPNDQKKMDVRQHPHYAQ